MISLDIKFSDDPKFQHLQDTLRVLAYVFTHHIDLWLQMYRNLNFMLTGFTNLTASMFFNHLMKSNAESSEISKEHFNIVANTFVEAIKQTPTLKRYVENDGDAVLTMWKFCHYLFVPVRLNEDTIPLDVKVNSLKRWITTVFVIPFNIEYTSKFSNLIKRYNVIHDGIEKMTDMAIQQFKTNIKIDWINKIINDYYNVGQFTQEFIRTFMYVLVLSSIDILKKYNPFVKEACAINPNYDGRWIPSFGDEMINIQLRKINELTPLVKLRD